MNILKLIGVGFQFVGSALLSFSLIKSHQQIEDETKGFFGQNPFAAVNLIAERKITRFGLGLMVTGFALLFSTTLAETVDTGWGEALIFGVVLGASGLLLLYLFSVLKEQRHRRIHRQYYRSELRNQLLKLRDELAQKDTHSTRAFRNWKKASLPLLQDYENNITLDLWEKLQSGMIDRLPRQTNPDKTKRFITHFIEEHFEELEKPEEVQGKSIHK
ncbi:MAG: hypothetical protein V1853_02025 [bacterium]